eukprot:2760475-Pyramimonas_sp.AAC.1
MPGHVPPYHPSPHAREADLHISRGVLHRLAKDGKRKILEQKYMTKFKQDREIGVCSRTLSPFVYDVQTSVALGLSSGSYESVVASPQAEVIRRPTGHTGTDAHPSHQAGPKWKCRGRSAWIKQTIVAPSAAKRPFLGGSPSSHCGKPSYLEIALGVATAAIFAVLSAH